MLASAGLAAGAHHSHQSSQPVHEAVAHHGGTLQQEAAYNPADSVAGIFDGMTSEALPSTRDSVAHKDASARHHKTAGTSATTALLPASSEQATPTAADSRTESTAPKVQAEVRHQAAVLRPTSAKHSSSKTSSQTTSNVVSSNAATQQLTETLKAANAPPASSNAVSANDLQQLYPDLAANLAQNLFPTDATLAGILELHGITYTRDASTISFSASSVTLFYGKTFNGAFSPDASHTAALTGTYTLSSQQFVLAGFNLVLRVGDALTIQATDVHFQYTPQIDKTPSQFSATVDGAQATAGLFSSVQSVTGAALNFQLTNNGFSFGGFTLNATTGGTPSIGNYLSATGLTLTVTGPFSVVYGSSPSVTGSVSLGLTGLSIYPGAGNLTAGGASVSGSYSFANFDGTSPSGLLTISVSNFSLTLAGQVMVSAPGTTTITPGAALVDSFGTVNKPATAATAVSLTLTAIPADPTNVTVTLTANGTTQSITDYKISGQTLTLPSYYSSLDNLKVTSATITATYTPSLVSIPTATVTIVPLNLSVTVQNVAVKSTGLAFDNATFTATSSAAIGGLLSVTDPKVTLEQCQLFSGRGRLAGCSEPDGDRGDFGLWRLDFGFDYA